MGSYDWISGVVDALWYAQTTSAAPTATRPAAVSSAGRPVGTSGTLDGLSSRGSLDGVSSRGSTETGLRDRRIGKPTYRRSQMRLPYASWELPTSAFDPSWWVNASACGEPILFRRGGSYVTVITGPHVSVGYLHDFTGGHREVG